MIRRGTEADLPWMLKAAKAKQEWLGVGSFDTEYTAGVWRDSRVFTDGSGQLWGCEMPSTTSADPALNYVLFWDSDRNAWPLLKAHEASSNLPSAVFVPSKHERQEALMKALRRRGYAPHETLMVKHG
jgi:hypothetical protein